MPRRNRDVRVSRRELRAGEAARTTRVRAAARRLRRPRRGRAVRRSGISTRCGARSRSRNPIWSRSTTRSGWRPASRRCAISGSATSWSSMHAMAIPYRTRSHFDGQAILETGIDRPVGSSDGWLNRLLQVMTGERSGIAIASGMPRSMTGPFDVQTWSPTQLGAVDDEYLERLAVLYRTDQIAARPIRGGAAAAESRRRRADGRRRRAARRHHAADAGGGAHPRAGRRAQHRGGGVQRMGHAREPGAGRRRAGSPARSARRRARWRSARRWAPRGRTPPSSS